MSEHHQFVLNIDVANGVEPKVRMWIDDQQTSDLESEQEIQLLRDGHSSWSAEFSTSGPFMYRIGIVAAPGSRWSIAFRSAGDDSQELLFDSDELTMTKEWLVGTCETFDASPRSVRESGLGFQLLSS